MARPQCPLQQHALSSADRAYSSASDSPGLLFYPSCAACGSSFVSDRATESLGHPHSQHGWGVR